MNHVQSICVVDDNPLVQVGWERSLNNYAKLFYYKDPRSLMEAAEAETKLIPSFKCIILGRMFPHLYLDIVSTDIPQRIRQQALGPVFLNWQGFISKDYLEKHFDGKIFHRYGIKWHTLKLRIQRIERQKISERNNCSHSQKSRKIVTRDQRCQELLNLMGGRASGGHRKKIQYYANHDTKTGIRLLEEIYNQLLISKYRPTSCPSKYINSSPMIAAKILRGVLYQ